MDIFSTEKRSAIMRNIKGINTAPELVVRKYLFKLGYRFSLHRRKMPGTPDIVLKKYKTVIFVNGCFWHGHNGCNKSSLPKTRTSYWSDKIEANRIRDKINIEKLEALGWKVITIYQCELRNKNIESTMERVLSKLIK
jgi:DNA mismatch endonuclease (patch repair protein)